MPYLRSFDLDATVKRPLHQGLKYITRIENKQGYITKGKHNKYMHTNMVSTYHGMNPLGLFDLGTSTQDGIATHIRHKTITL